MIDKICIITGHFPPQHSAVGDYVLRLSEAMADEGARVSVLTSIPAGEMAAKEGINVLVVTNGWGMRGAWQIIKILRQENPRIVSLQYVPQMYNQYGITLAVALLPLAIRLILHLPVVTTCHEFLGSNKTPKEAFLQIFYALQALLIFIGSCRIVVPIERYVEIIQTHYRPFARKARLIPVGSNIPIRTIDRQKSVIENTPRQKNWTIATLGTGHFWWNYGFALRTISLLRQKGYNVRLVCIGGVEKTNPSYFSELKYSTERLGLNKYVTWTGYREAEDVSSLLYGADIFLFTQINGPSMKSTALMAALSHGLPVVAIRGDSTDQYLLESGVTLLVSGR